MRHPQLGAELARDRVEERGRRSVGGRLEETRVPGRGLVGQGLRQRRQRRPEPFGPRLPREERGLSLAEAGALSLALGEVD
ncbi:MAG: hypothetical protein ABFS41_19450, partial [Myxococcota bacterium]